MKKVKLDIAPITFPIGALVKYKDKLYKTQMIILNPFDNYPVVQLRNFKGEIIVAEPEDVEEIILPDLYFEQGVQITIKWLSALAGSNPHGTVYTVCKSFEHKLEFTRFLFDHPVRRDIGEYEGWLIEQGFLCAYIPEVFTLNLDLDWDY